MSPSSNRQGAPAALDLSSADDLQRYLLASLDARGHGAPISAARFRRAAQWLSSLYALGWDRLPFFMVYDLGYLLLEGPAFPFRSLLSDAEAAHDPASPDQRRRVAYENRLLNRLLSLPVFSSLRAAMDDAPAAPDQRVIATIACWLSPLQNKSLSPMTTSAQTLRQVSTPPALTTAQAVIEAEHALSADGLFAHQAEVAVEIMGAAPLAALIQPEDLFIIQHAEALSSDALRITARQLASIEQRLGDADPPPAHMRREPPQTQVNLTDAGFFPQGGLDQLANRGAIENLVRTELAYIDDAADIDLFTMRYLEGELLYYTRDDAQLLRRSRTTHVALDFTSAHHIQYPNHPAQLSLMLRALTARLIDDLFTLFSSDSLRVVLHLHDRRASDAIDLWRIRFADLIARGELEVVIDDARPIPSPTDASPDALNLCAQRLVSPGRLTTLIMISASAPLTPPQTAALARDGLHLLHLQIPAPPPADTHDDTPPPPNNPLAVSLSSPNILDALRAARQRLLWALFGC